MIVDNLFSLIYFQGDNVPPPFISFEASGFPPELLREVWTSVSLLVVLLFFLFGPHVILVAKISCKFAKLCPECFLCKVCDCWRSDVEFQTHVNIFCRLYFLSQVRYLLLGGANVVRCVPSLWGACH